MTVLDLKLGEAANLLYGVKPRWTGDASAFFPPAVPPMSTADTVITPEKAGWGFPIVTLHDDAEGLISELYDYQVRPATGDTGDLSIPAGPLALDDRDRAAAQKAAGEYIGIDLTKNYSYMLVRVRRSVGKAVHESVAHFGDKNRDDYLTDDAKKVLEELPAGDPVTSGDELRIGTKLTSRQASAYVEALHAFGTHFVSTVEAGDLIFQVFAYEAARFASLKAAFDHDRGGQDRITGLEALDYQYYTTPTGPDSAHGFVAGYGDIVAFSRDPKLTETLAAGKWADGKYAPGNSIFQAFSAKNNVAKFLSQFQAVAPIAVTLSPLADLVPEVFQAKVLDRLFKGAILQKYGARIQVPFDAPQEYDWPSLFPGSTDSWLSSIATPAIDVYQELIDLGAVQMVNTEVVESFTAVSFALLLGGKQPVDLPGARITLASYILDTSRSPATIRVASDALKNLSLSFGEMYGALTIAAVDGTERNVILDGFRFAADETDPSTNRSKVALVGDVLAPPDANTLAALTTDLQFSLVSAESLMWSRSARSAEVRELTVGYLNWLANLVPDDSEDEDLVAMAAQALYLAKAALNLSTEGTAVPYLTFDSYNGFVGSMLTVADSLSGDIREYQAQIRSNKQAELTAKTAEEINQNIKATGELLTKYFGVLAANQRDISGYYQSVVDQRRQEFSKTVTDIAKLEASLRAQQANVNKSVEDFKKAVVAWETEQILKFCFQVATDVFSLAVAFAVPATEISAVKSLGETVQKIQKVFNVLAALSKLETGIETTVRSLQGAQRALSQLDAPLDMPSSLEWQEFSINMKASLASVPGDLTQAKADLVAAFEILALRGQALLTARAKQTQILTDIYFNERQKAINDKQAQRLGDLQDALHLGGTTRPDVTNIDLIGLTGQVQSQLKQVLAALAKTLVLQDAAVQYEYLGQPTPIQKFDLSSLKQVMMRQQANVINALNQLNPPPLPVDKPIEYRVAKVPYSELVDGAVYRFAIQPSAQAFWKYAMVRVDKVVARIDGIAGSDGGEYLAKLAFEGNPFEDRDAERKSITFNTVERHFGPYDYDIATGAPQFGDQTGKTDSKITNVTPFGNWQISLPPTETNKGLTFADHTVDIVLTFRITALLVDSARQLAARHQPMMLRAETGATLANLLDNMYNNQAVLKGWDVVFNVLEEPVNAFLAKQYKDKYPGQDQTVNIGFCQGPFPIGDDYVATYTKVQVVLGGPLLQFQQNNHDYVTVKQAIKSGYTQSGSKAVPDTWNPACDCDINDPEIRWGKQKPIDVTGGPYVEGAVPLSQVQGLVEPSDPNSTTHSVVLDFKQGSFVAKNLDVHTDNAMVNLQLGNWFATHEIRYIINTLDYSNVTALPALKPTKFLLNVLTTDGSANGGGKKNILQQYITTNGTQKNNLTINVNQPIPDGSDCSLMINTKIMFYDIFTASFNKGSSNIIVEPLDPGKDFEAWSARIKSGQVKGTVNFPDDGRTQYRIDANGSSLSWDIIGLTFQRTKQLAIQLGYSTTKTQSFQVRQKIRTRFRSYWGDWNTHSVAVNVLMSGNYPITIHNSGEYAGKNQTIQLASTPPTVDVSNTSLRPTGLSECNDNDLQIAVRDELAKDVPGALASQMASIKFEPISLFALENLLFPGGTLITMDGAYVPGDLVVIGHFKDLP